MDASDTEVCDLYRFEIPRKQQVLWLYVAVDDIVLMRVPYAGTHLLDVVNSPCRLEHFILR